MTTGLREHGKCRRPPFDKLRANGTRLDCTKKFAVRAESVEARTQLAAGLPEFDMHPAPPWQSAPGHDAARFSVPTGNGRWWVRVPANT
jgi:hypothetical protein